MSGEGAAARVPSERCLGLAANPDLLTWYVAGVFQKQSGHFLWESFASLESYLHTCWS